MAKLYTLHTTKPSAGNRLQDRKYRSIGEAFFAYAEYACGVGQGLVIVGGAGAGALFLASAGSVDGMIAVVCGVAIAAWLCFALRMHRPLFA